MGITMEFVFLLLIVGITFGLCFLVDKGFQKAFRSAPQHASGMSVRLNKHFGGIGTAVVVLGICGILAGLGDGWLLIGGGAVLVLVGAGFVVYYMTFGIYYDDDSFVLCTFGKPNATYGFEEIRAQQLYIASGQTVIELHLADGAAVQLQQSMTGVDKFMDKAFAGWLRQKGLSLEECPFHDPDNSCWFPPFEEN